MSEQYERIAQLIAQQKLPLISVADLSGITQDEANQLVDMAFELHLHDIVWLLRVRFAQIGIQITTTRSYGNRTCINTRYDDLTDDQSKEKVRKYKLASGKFYELNLNVFPHVNLVPVIDKIAIKAEDGGITVEEIGKPVRSIEDTTYSEFSIIFPRPTSNLDLKERRSEHLTEYKFLEWLYQMVIGVKSLHDQNFIHRNIKPENVLFYGDGVSEIIKIGGHWNSIVEILEDDGEYETFGTPGYMPPERKESKSMDIYSLGCTILVMMTGISDEELQTLAKLCNKENFQHYKEFILEKINSCQKVERLQTDLIELVVAMMDPDPDNRPTIEKCVQIVSELYFKKRLMKKAFFDCEFIFKANKKDEHDDEHSDSENRKHEYTSFECVD